mmetsp:Transcript_16231/g.43354  ORF Transcript_16231/g.43354 Transcript_16231/m.43354 type:complete len:237 (-) Transcript_16231:24-734(-)
MAAGQHPGRRAEWQENTRARRTRRQRREEEGPASGGERPRARLAHPPSDRPPPHHILLSASILMVGTTPPGHISAYSSSNSSRRSCARYPLSSSSPRYMLGSCWRFLSAARTTSSSSSEAPRPASDSSPSSRAWKAAPAGSLPWVGQQGSWATAFGLHAASGRGGRIVSIAPMRITRVVCTIPRTASERLSAQGAMSRVSMTETLPKESQYDKLDMYEYVLSHGHPGVEVHRFDFG